MILTCLGEYVWRGHSVRDGCASLLLRVLFLSLRTETRPFAEEKHSHFGRGLGVQISKKEAIKVVTLVTKVENLPRITQINFENRSALQHYS